MRTNKKRTKAAKKPGLTAAERREIAQALGRVGGLRGGRARAEALTPAERRAVSVKGNAARGSRNRPILELPVRVSMKGKRKTCSHCGLPIRRGESYRDGISRRFHVDPPCDKRAAYKEGKAAA